MLFAIWAALHEQEAKPRGGLAEDYMSPEIKMRLSCTSRVLLELKGVEVVSQPQASGFLQVRARTLGGEGGEVWRCAGAIYFTSF